MHPSLIMACKFMLDPFQLKQPPCIICWHAEYIYPALART